ncbi:hypothetical protein J2T57_002834 [Natronocella acetinitrilica]|uniref:Competence protein CoiA-like N-terminal domain-containing protein n=1 Tax=Natronocella acetinitrilica TaxID=414046 RepID=A0AAE3G4V8_9GAMM|nr:competence protein CoiA family protein [Natronocella acetinitrilica]MCP1675684.1 hypothetical protein [Natronocella acetinitrilica]
MSKSEILLQSFGIDKQGHLVSVLEVVNGKACGCACPVCGGQLVARQGEVRAWHFAHASASHCDGAAETVLHLAAKELILRRQGMMLPGATATATHRLPDGRQATATAELLPAWADFEAVHVEKAFRELRPDLLVTLGGKPMFVEVAVTHFIDAIKETRIQELGIPTVEIALDVSLRESWSWDQLEQAVIDGHDGKRWINCPWAKEIMEEAQRRALAAANQQSVPEATTKPRKAKAPRTRFVVRGCFVDVIERPFGIAVWSPYHPEVNRLIKQIVQPLGGAWKPSFKNWLLPLKARDSVLSALDDIATNPGRRIG